VRTEVKKKVPDPKQVGKLKRKTKLRKMGAEVEPGRGWTPEGGVGKKRTERKVSEGGAWKGSGMGVSQRIEQAPDGEALTGNQRGVKRLTSSGKRGLVRGDPEGPRLRTIQDELKKGGG